MPDVRTVCPYCGVGCGLVLNVQSGRLVGTRPEPGHPVSRGTLCPKGATAHEPVQHADRLTRPMVRKNGELAPATWEEALDAAARGLRQAVRESGPRASAVIASARGTVEEAYVAQKLARAALGTNNVDNCYRICHSPTVIGLGWSFGSGAMTNPVPDFAEAEVILLVGSNAPHSHPIIWSQWMRPAVRRGAKLVVVDPRATQAAKAATLHVRARPGSEIALLNAMSRHILASGLEDREFIAARTEGFDAFRAAVEPFTLERGEAETGVPAPQIRAAAETYARAERASIAYGLGVTEHRNGTDNVRALANLALLTGNVGKPGTGVNALRGQNDVQGATDMCRPESLPGYQPWSDRAVVDKFERSWGARLPVPTEKPEDWLWCSRMWESALEGELKALYAIGTDPALTEGNVGKVRRALESLDCLIVQEPYPSVTTKYATVVFPASTFAEKDGTFVNTDRRVQRVRKAVDPPGEARADLDILLAMSERLGYPMPHATAEDVFEEIRRLVPSFAGITYARLEASGGVAWPCPDVAHPGTPRLHESTFPRGRARFAALSPTAPAEEPDAEYPVLLTTGRAFMQYNAGTMTRRSRMEKGEPACWVELSPKDASRIGVADGEPVRVTTRRGSVVAQAKVVDVAEGVAWMPFHYAETPVNRITNDAVDPESGVTELKVAAARVERA